jgi:hypothetical protein
LTTLLIRRLNVKLKIPVTIVTRDHLRAKSVADQDRVINVDQHHVIVEGHPDVIAVLGLRHGIVALQESDEAHPTPLLRLPTDPEVATIADVTILTVTIHDVTEIQDEDPILVTTIVVGEAGPSISTPLIKFFFQVQ